MHTRTIKELSANARCSVDLRDLSPHTVLYLVGDLYGSRFPVLASAHPHIDSGADLVTLAMSLRGVSIPGTRPLEIF